MRSMRRRLVVPHRAFLSDAVFAVHHNYPFAVLDAVLGYDSRWVVVGDLLLTHSLIVSVGSELFVSLRLMPQR